MGAPDTILCPKCGRPMAAGYSRAPHGIHWGQAPRQLRWRAIWSVLPNTLASWRFRANPAWRCYDCHTLLVDCSQSIAAK